MGKLEAVFEVVRIKQIIKEVEHNFASWIVRSPDDAAKVAKAEIGDDDREVFLVLVLNTKNHVIALHRAHTGSLNSSIVHPREVMKAAILNNGASIIVAHQHPSGDPNPSNEDIQVTERLVKAGKTLGIELLDSLIVTPNEKYTSLKEKGYIN